MVNYRGNFKDFSLIFLHFYPRSRVNSHRVARNLISLAEKTKRIFQHYAETIPIRYKRRLTQYRTALRKTANRRAGSRRHSSTTRAFVQRGQQANQCPTLPRGSPRRTPTAGQLPRNCITNDYTQTIVGEMVPPIFTGQPEFADNRLVYIPSQLV